MVYKVHHARSGGVLHGARPGGLTFNPENGSSIFLRNSYKYLPKNVQVINGQNTIA
jgi:hypothetical protein